MGAKSLFGLVARRESRASLAGHASHGDTFHGQAPHRRASHCQGAGLERVIEVSID
jgi:hypothetical protein